MKAIQGYWFSSLPHRIALYEAHTLEVVADLAGEGDLE